jgi:hypothetical protein
MGAAAGPAWHAPCGPEGPAGPHSQSRVGDQAANIHHMLEVLLLQRSQNCTREMPQRRPFTGVLLCFASECVPCAMLKLLAWVPPEHHAET